MRSILPFLAFLVVMPWSSGFADGVEVAHPDRILAGSFPIPFFLSLNEPATSIPILSVRTASDSLKVEFDPRYAGAFVQIDTSKKSVNIDHRSSGPSEYGKFSLN